MMASPAKTAIKGVLSARRRKEKRRRGAKQEKQDKDVETFPPFTMADFTEDTDQKRTEILRTLSVYSFLRTFSYALNLSPFDVETFLLSLSPQKSLMSNSLLTAIHLSLLRICCMIYSTDLGAWTNLDWTFMDSFTWPCYISPLLKLARKKIVLELIGNNTKDKNTSKDNDDFFIDTFEYKQLQSAIDLIQSKGHYFKLSMYDKICVLNCIIDIFMKHPNFLDVIEERAKAESPNLSANNSKIDPSPWSLLKGDDGSVENCILCDEGGNLVCCDFCPVGYHKECLNENTKAFDGEWSCYECNIPDPANGKARMKFTAVTSTIKMKMIGRFPVLFVSDRPGETDATAYILTPAQVVQTLTRTKNSHLIQMFEDYSKLLGQLVYFNEKRKKDKDLNAERLQILRKLSLQMVTEDEHDKDSKTSKGEKYRHIVIEHDDKLYGSDIYNVNGVPDEVIKRLGTNNVRIEKVCGKTFYMNMNNDNSILPEASLSSFDQMKNIPPLNSNDMSLMTTHHSFDVKVLADRYLPANYTNHYVGNKPIGPGYFPSCRLHQRSFIDPLYTLCYRLYNRPDILLAGKDASSILWPIYDERTLSHSKGYLVDNKDKNHDFALLSLCRLLEIIYNLLSPLTGKLFNENPFATDSFHIQLFHVNTLDQFKKLVIQFTDSLNPFALNPLFFLPVEELRDKTIGSARSLQIRLFGIKPIFVRVDHFTKLGTSRCRRKSDKRNYELEADPIASERSRLLESIISYFKEDQLFSTGRRICGTESVCRLPKYLLRRLARNGGVALLPNFAYKANKTYASPPFIQNWCGRVEQCTTTYDMALMLRYFEQGIQDSLTGLNVRNNNLVIKSKVGHFDDEFGEKSRQKDIMTNIISIRASHSQLHTLKLVQGGKLPKEHSMSLPTEIRSIKTDFLAFYNTMNTISMKDDETLGKEIGMQSWKDYFLRRWMESITKKHEDRNKNTPSNRAFFLLQKFAIDILEIMIQNNNMNEELYTVARDVLNIYKNTKDSVKDEIVNILISSKIALPEAARTIASYMLNRAINGAVEIVKYVNSGGLSKGPTSSNSETNNNGVMKVEKQTVKLSVCCFDRLFDSFQMQVFKNKRPSNFLTIEEHYNKTTISPQYSNQIDRSLCTLERLCADIESYIPQVGDELIYYASGHKDYLDVYFDSAPQILSAKRRGLVKKKKTQSKNTERVPCRVLTIDFEFPVIPKGPKSDTHKVICLLQLGTLGPGQKERQIFVLYQPGHTCGEFLVSKERMQTCLLRQFQPNNYFSMVYYGGQRYEGKILELIKDDDLFPVWAGAKVYWEETGEDHLNEWELDPPNVKCNESEGKNDDKLICSNTNSIEEFVLLIIDDVLTDTVARSKLYSSLVHDTSVLETRIQEIKAQTEKEILLINKMLHQIAINLMKVVDFDPFCYEVTNDIAPEYNQIIAIPMHLDLMRLRASNNYYRQPQAFLGDARTIYVNCSRYNSDMALITLKAGELYRTVYTSIKESFPKEKLFDYLQFEKVFGDKGLIQTLIDKVDNYY